MLTNVTSGTDTQRRLLRPTEKVLPGHARAHNRSMVLQHLFHSGPWSRADLARATGLTRVTVSDLVSSLMAEGLVTELGLRSEGKVGKPGTLVGLRTDAFQIVAVDLADDERMHGAVLDLSGEVRARRSSAVAGRARASRRSRRCSTCAASSSPRATMPVLGVGVGIPGRHRPVRHGARRRPTAAGSTSRSPTGSAPTSASRSTWPTTPTPRRSASTPTAARPDSLLVLTVGEGVGAGIVLDGALVQGHQHAAGELGHVTAVDERDDIDGAPLGRPQPCACGRKGCLETVLSVPALRRRVEGLDAAAAEAALAAVGRRLGIVLAPVVSALNLSEVVVSGPSELLDGPLRAAALAALRERTMPVICSNLQLRMTSLGEDGALSGAAVLVLSGQLGVS